MCIHPECTTRPTYNMKGESKALYCSAHKTEGMVDVVSKTCIHPECTTLPTYNTKGESKALYCSAHKTEGMVDVIHKTCIHPECTTQPTYNTKGESKALYCSAHKTEGMVDVVSKTCIHPECTTHPTYNTKGESKALYCSAHKTEGMVDVKNKTCKNNWCFTLVAEKYDGYCMYCYIHMFPDKPVARNYKTKEFAVIEFIQNKFPYFDWVTDKKINNGCSKRRPDILLDLGYQIIIIEIDENQHIDYDCSCENKRIMELSKDVGHRSIIFIRFNPDDYLKNKENITSCWGVNKKGICVVRKSKKDEWNDRLQSLENTILYWTNPINKTMKTIETIKLFYDI